MKTIYLAGGCFWGLQKFFDQFEGVISTTVGYANGLTENPSYEEVKSQKSGHAETLLLNYDPDKFPLSEVLEKYYLVIDPVSVNKQGEDEGISYRTGIYYTDEAELDTINSVTDKIRAKYKEPIAVEIEPLRNFYPAEEYHQKYLEKNPGGYCHIGSCFFG